MRLFLVFVLFMAMLPLVAAHEEIVEGRVPGREIEADVLSCPKADVSAAVEKALARDGLEPLKMVVTTDSCERGRYEAIVLITLKNGKEIKAEVEATEIETKVRIAHGEEEEKREEVTPAAPPTESVLVKVLAYGKPVVAVGFSVDNEGTVTSVSMGEVLKLMKGTAYIAALGFPLHVVELNENTVIDLAGFKVEEKEPGFSEVSTQPVVVKKEEIMPQPVEKEPPKKEPVVAVPTQPVVPEKVEKAEENKRKKMSKEELIKYLEERGYVVREVEDVFERNGLTVYKMKVVKPGKVLGIIPMPLLDQELVIEVDEEGNFE